MTRPVEHCPFRRRAHQHGDVEVAECRLLQAALGSQRAPFPVRRDACEHCCRLALPSLERPNAVVASLLYDAASRIIGADGVGASEIRRALRIQREAIHDVETTQPQGQPAGIASPVLPVLSPRRLIDEQVTADLYTERLSRREPFGYLRYGDGEWLSMLGERGKTAAGHDFFPETAGRDLRRSLDYVASLHPDNENLYVGLYAGRLESQVQTYLKNRGLTAKVHWVDCNLLQRGLRDLATKRFLQAVREFDGPRFLVANRWLAPVAQGLGCTHVTIPEVNCYLAIDRAESACWHQGQGLVLFCASFASECLICRLHQRNPSSIYVDCGHVFDAIVWRPTRDYTKNNRGGIVDLLKAHYGPMFPTPHDG